MRQHPRIVSIHPHYRDREFVVLVERNGAKYAITTGILGRPVAVQAVQGRMMVYHKHLGFGSYSLEISAEQVGGDTPMLDPLCAAIIEKGWSHNLLSLSLGKLSQPDDKYALKRTWEDIDTNFYISDISTPEWWRLFGRNLPAWLIIVEWYQGKPHLFVRVSFPDIYDKSEALAALLEAINSLPDASSFENMHPAALTS